MSKKPNIVFILQDHQAYYGHGDYEGGVRPKRPNFEQFCKTGVKFNNARCVTPMCGPARRSLLTALYPHKHGQVHNENTAPYKNELFLNILKDNGYKNYYYGKWHAGEGKAEDLGCEGFSDYSYGNPYITKEYKEYLKRKGLPKASHYVEHCFMTESYIEENFFPKLKEGKEYSCESTWCGEHASGITTTAKETHESFFLSSLACEKLEELAEDKNQPFCLSVHFWGPHQPFFPTKEFADLYDPKEIGEYPSFKDPLDNQPDVLKMELSYPLTSDGKFIDSPNNLPWSTWQEILARCYAHISMIDSAAGEIVKKLRSLGLDENTLIIWTTDHGDALAIHGGHFDKDSHMAEEVMKVPLAMNYKGKIAENIENDDFVFTCDIPVTILDAANLSFSKEVDGKSLFNLLKNKEPWRKSLMCESYGHGYGTTIKSRMVVDERYKYIATENDLEQLYDLKNDPFELKNLADLKSYNDIKLKMRNLLIKQQQDFKDPVKIDELIN